jgi:hypothetical protein
LTDCTDQAFGVLGQYPRTSSKFLLVMTDGGFDFLRTHVDELLQPRIADRTVELAEERVIFLGEFWDRMLPPISAV